MSETVMRVGVNPEDVPGRSRRRRLWTWAGLIILAGVLVVAGLSWTRHRLARGDQIASRPIRVDRGVGPFYRAEDEPPPRVPRGTPVHHPLLEAVRRDWVRGDGVFPISPAGWKARMAALCGFARAGTGAVPTLVAALDDADPHVRSVAAQALGIVGDRSAAATLDAMLLGDPDAECRVYAAHARSMIGGMIATPRYRWSLALDRLFSFRDQLRLALDRGRDPLPSAVRQAYAHYDLATMDTARLGARAPDFAVPAANGRGPIRLRDFLGKSQILLVFIYGST